VLKIGHAGQTTAINIPLPHIFHVLVRIVRSSDQLLLTSFVVQGMSDEDFEDEFQFPKPALEQKIVFSCKAGVRSLQAAKVASEMHQYENVLNYRGSADEWFS
jgi:rhodanese-related sulfurtransferase